MHLFLAVALGGPLGSLATARLVKKAGFLGTASTKADAKWFWRSCANEDEFITEPGATTRFGFGGAWKEASLPSSGAPCSAQAFGGGDPVPGIRKVCECSDTNTGSDKREELGVVWDRCAHEGGQCRCPSGPVRFGLGARWVLSKPGVPTEQIMCTSTSFRNVDPDLGAPKECWCQQPHPQLPKNRVALVTSSRRPTDFGTWLRYHLDYMQVEHIFLHLEDTPGFHEFWKTVPPSHQKRVTLWEDNLASEVDKENRPSDDYSSLQARQIATMKRAREAAMTMGIDWLLHIDDDELLYSPERKPVGEILAGLPQSVSQAFVPNVEAVYPSPDIKSCFPEVSKANTNPYTYVSYVNGKAAVRVAGADDDVIPAGPHEWQSSVGLMLPSIHLDQEPFGTPLFVLHFESCPVVRWEEKYWELGNTSPEKLKAIPFGFYRESIQKMQHCGKWRPGASGVNQQTRPAECSEDALKALWAEHKTMKNPAFREQDMMPVEIPWVSILAKGAS